MVPYMRGTITLSLSLSGGYVWEGGVRRDDHDILNVVCRVSLVVGVHHVSNRSGIYMVVWFQYRLSNEKKKGKRFLFFSFSPIINRYV